jgi:imidazole glycerol-phosphate synthase subunit HisH
MTTLTVIDYGVGNLFNLCRAFESLGVKTVLTSDPDEILRSERLILPGVGAFGAGITNLKELGLIPAILEYARTRRPIFGICLGMQLLFSESFEHGHWKGLNVLPGKVDRIDGQGCKLPQIAWNTLIPTRDWKGTILEGLPLEAQVYFNHSYCVSAEDVSDSLALTTYGATTFSSVVNRGNIFGCQFHPERSGKWGLLLLKNFATMEFPSW